MKKNTLPFVTAIFLMALFGNVLLCAQNNREVPYHQIDRYSQILPLNPAKKIRIRLAVGAGFSSAENQLKGHLRESGLGDKLNAKGDWLYSGGNDFYPQSEVVRFVGALSIDYRLGKYAWFGVTVGIDPSASATGYDRFGTDYGFWAGTYSIGQFATLKQGSWFWSPQLSFNSTDGKFGIFGGPTFEYHILSIQWEDTVPVYKRPTTIGAVFGARAGFVGRWEWFVSYRLSADVQYWQTSNTMQAYSENTSVLPDRVVNFSHFRTGITYSFSL